MKANPIPPLSPRDIKRFWSKVNTGEGCWLWMGARNDGGYGRFWAGKRGIPAHRVSFTLARGVIKDGLVIDHLCRNRACVNPAHLEAVTQQTNVRRGERASIARGEPCSQGHEMTPENTVIEKRGSIRCRKCHRAYMRDYMRERYRKKNIAVQAA